MRERVMEVGINLFKVLEWDPVFQFRRSPENPKPGDLLRFLCAFDEPSEMSALRERYVEVSKIDRSLSLSLRELGIGANLYGPLKQAKTNYVLGNYVGSIALCGIVAEKVAILVHALNTPDNSERSRFQGDPQGKRVKELKKRRLISEPSKQNFDCIRDTRRFFLHFWITGKECTAQQALRAYSAATHLVLDTINFNYVNGIPTLNPKLMTYLEEQGYIKERGVGE